jgi:hypothetical protein
MEREKERFLVAGKLFVSASREKVITFQAYRIIIKRAKYSLNAMNGFVNL